MIRCAILFVVLTHSGILRAQEVKTIDLTLVQQRTELRHPPAPEADCAPGGSCVGGGYGGGSVADGAPDRRDPHALAVYLLRVDPSDIDPAKPFQVEFRVLNSGLAPIELPISPHLSDLQPADAASVFSYLSLALVVNTEAQQFVEFIELYGAPDHEGSTLTLTPGRWITVKANIKTHSAPAEPMTTRFQGDFWLRRVTFHPHPGGNFTEVQNLYPNRTPTPGIAVHLLHPASPND